MKWRPKALEGHKKSCGKRELERSRGWKHPRWIIYAPIKTDEALISLSLSLTRIFSIGNSFWLLRLLSGNWQRFGCLWLVDHTKRCGYRHNLTTSSSRQALHFIELTLLPTCSWKKKTIPRFTQLLVFVSDFGTEHEHAVPFTLKPLPSDFYARSCPSMRNVRVASI